MALFSLQAVSRTWRDRTVLNNITVDIPPRTITAIVGPSGAGKTSFIRLLNRLDDPETGYVSFASRPLKEYPVRTLRQRVGFVFQTPAMFAGTVGENLRTAAMLAEQNLDVAERLREAGLDASYENRIATELSGGEQQRVSVARALATKPDVLLLDEPTSALDPEVADKLIRTIRDLCAIRDMSVVMVTHRLAEARTASTFLIMLEAGQVVETGATETLFTEASSERARAYLKMSV